MEIAVSPSAWKRALLFIFRGVLLLALIGTFLLTAASGLAFFLRPAVFGHFFGLIVVVSALLGLTFALSRAHLIVFGSIAAAGLVAVFGSTAIADWVRFQFERDDLLARKAQILNNSGACSEACYIDAGPPPSIMFVWNGFLDSSWGVCYDPGATLATSRRARNARTEAPAYDHASVMQRHVRTKVRLARDWYSCTAGF